MKICVQGLWHLGSVTAACLASAGHEVAGLDPNLITIANLSKGKAPLFEPGLDDLLVFGLTNSKLSFYTDHLQATADAEVLWVTFDTPVNEEDEADIDFVQTQIQGVLPFLKKDAIVLVSSQMPVGSIKKLEAFAQKSFPDKHLSFAYSPENLRLGKALDVFLKPDRIVVGVRNESDRKILQRMLSPITDKIEWMSVESAEMTKHAINAFLAISVTFANEIASICELVGADAKDVERGLKTEARIGPKAYVSPGGPFAGGTLARDIVFLGKESKAHELTTPLLSAIKPSNDEHKNWTRRNLLKYFGSLHGVTIAVWGLTYKPGTDTLRRSLAVELCNWLVEQGAKVNVYDPTVKNIPERWGAKVVCSSNAMQALNGADALVVGTEWPEFKKIAEGLSAAGNAGLVIIDANRHLLSSKVKFIEAGYKYIAVGTPVTSGA
ncbi:UDP-glucose/GDP-mannose dehydrogenase family protein [Polynucleobacter paneuropaeus]|nr:UDP-glucose/GDP-mannose dehydrogenase family protein [Polynucleobacter paneuropaeus]